MNRDNLIEKINSINFNSITKKNNNFLDNFLSLLISSNILKNEELNQKPANCLVVGKSGSGKTFLIENILTELKIPSIVIDAKQFSEVGYQGKDIYNIFEDVNRLAQTEEVKIEDIVIIIDEFDKLQEKKSTYRDISGSGVQDSLLKILDGIDIEVSTQSRFPKIINTKDLVFIFVGAFSFLSDYSNMKYKMISSGFSTELVNRVQNIFEISDNTQEDYIEYFNRENNNLFYRLINCYEKLGFEVKFKDYETSVKEVVKLGIELDNSFRGIEFIINQMLHENLMENIRNKRKDSYIFIEGIKVDCLSE